MVGMLYNSWRQDGVMIVLQEAGAALPVSSDPAKFELSRGVGLLITGRPANGSSKLKHILVCMLNRNI